MKVLLISTCFLSGIFSIFLYEKLLVKDMQKRNKYTQRRQNFRLIKNKKY